MCFPHICFFTDLSFQAASQIKSTPVYDALKVMKDIAQNFPVKARYDNITFYGDINYHLMFVFEFNEHCRNVYPNHARK